MIGRRGRKNCVRRVWSLDGVGVIVIVALVLAGSEFVLGVVGGTGELVGGVVLVGGWAGVVVFVGVIRVAMERA